MSNQKISELEEQLALMQKEIERLKQENNAPAVPSQSVWDKHKDKLESAQKNMFNEYGKILHEENIHSITTYISVGKFPDTGKIEMLCSGTGMFSSLDDLNEEGLAAALDVYTNPRRIAILKVLVKAEMMSATEISQRTGLQSGQLYHHLSILESAGLIIKTAEKYKADKRTQGILCGLFAVIGGMDIARK
jgi:DNA-binding transcriptional ArsR family regulator